jgi:hypothetical protein
VAHRAQDQLNAICWQVLKSEAWSLALLPCNFNIFGQLKKALKGCTFASDNNVQKAVVQWYRQQPKEFFAVTTCQLGHQGDSYVSGNGDFFWKHCNTFI